MDKEQSDRLINDPQNYRGNMQIYYCPGDHRLIVPRRSKMGGWTINFAHRDANRTLINLTVLPILPALFGFFIWPKTEIGMVIGIGVGTVLLIIYCIHLFKYTK